VSRFLPKFWRSALGTPSRAATVVGVTALGAAWLEHSPTGLAHWRTVAWRDAAPSQALELLRLQCGQAQFNSCQLVFAPSVLRHWLQSPPAQVASLRELQGVAQARCHQLFGNAPPAGTDPPGWSVAARWHASQAFVCTAIPTAWAQAVGAQDRTTTSSHDLVAQALHRYRASIPSTGWLALVIAHSLYVLQLRARAVLSLRALRLDRQADGQQILHTAKEEWTREMLRSNGSASTLSCLYLHPNALPSTVPAGLQILPTPWATRIPAPTAALASPDDASTGAAGLQLQQEALCTAWSAQQWMGGSAQ
jgi:hypothetical protein